MKEILLSIFLVFMIVISSLIFLEEFAGDSAYNLKADDSSIQENFYSKNFGDEKLVFLMGSSRVGSLNTDYIQNQISKEFLAKEIPKLTVYNVARHQSWPGTEIEHVKRMVSTNPTMVLYGLSYRDFQFPYEDGSNHILLPDPEIFLSEVLSEKFSEVFPNNPQFLTRFLINDILDPKHKDLKEIEAGTANTPFFENSTRLYQLKPLKEMLIVPDPLDTTSARGWNNDYFPYKSKIALVNIIEIFQERNIKLVIFTTPLIQSYLDTISESQKNELSKTLTFISEQYDIPVYDFTFTYANDEVWRDSTHISRHSNANKVNDDIVKIILKELDF